MRTAPRPTRRTVQAALVVVAVILVLIAVAIALRKPDPSSERPFPSYWSEIQEGHTTRAELIDRLGPPERAAEDCLFYDQLVQGTDYRFCFRDGVLRQKSAY